MADYITSYIQFIIIPINNRTSWRQNSPSKKKHITMSSSDSTNAPHMPDFFTDEKKKMRFYSIGALHKYIDGMRFSEASVFKKSTGMVKAMAVVEDSDGYAVCIVFTAPTGLRFWRNAHQFPGSNRLATDLAITDEYAELLGKFIPKCRDSMTTDAGWWDGKVPNATKIMMIDGHLEEAKKCIRRDPKKDCPGEFYPYKMHFKIEIDPITGLCVNKSFTKTAPNGAKERFMAAEEMERCDVNTLIIQFKIWKSTKDYNLNIYPIAINIEPGNSGGAADYDFGDMSEVFGFDNPTTTTNASGTKHVVDTDKVENPSSPKRTKVVHDDDDHLANLEQLMAAE